MPDRDRPCRRVSCSIGGRSEPEIVAPSSQELVTSRLARRGCRARDKLGFAASPERKEGTMKIKTHVKAGFNPQPDPPG